MIRSLAVIGAGLIGTSVALAATRRGLTVYLSDRDASAAATAAALGAGRAEPPPGPVDLAVIAVPPSQVGPVLAREQAGGLASHYTDVASVKRAPEQEVLDLAPDPSVYVGGHPLSGGERSGPLAASAEVFAGRTWVLTPSRLTSPAPLDRGLELVEVCGSVPLVMPSRTHDEVIALTSHLPHVVSSLLAARLLDGPAETPRLAGRGLADVTRIAGGSSLLWSDILRANAGAIARTLGELQADLGDLLNALEELAQDQTEEKSLRTVVDLLDRGIAGRARISG